LSIASAVGCIDCQNDVFIRRMPIVADTQPIVHPVSVLRKARERVSSTIQAPDRNLEQGKELRVTHSQGP
jgi:hypothetical protein